jgi:hypothetical protein
MTRLRVGGVPEHFNLPWRLAIEEGALAAAYPDVELEWVDMPGGTGAIMEALDRGTLDVATPLTEGAVTAITGGAAARIIGLWVDSPLLWGIHVAGSSTATSVDDLATGRFAISRFGSGSELMSRMLARERGWELDDDRFVVVQDLAGALAALPAGDAEVFLWNKSMTQPHVDDGTLSRVGVIPTPWPAFCVAARADLVAERGPLLRDLRAACCRRGRQLMGDPTLADLVVRRYGLATAEATEWAGQVRWSDPSDVTDTRVLLQVGETMHALGRVTRIADAADLLSPRAGRRTVPAPFEDTSNQVTARLEPNPGAGIVVVDDTAGQSAERLHAIELGIRHAALRPDDDGDPFIDFTVRVTAVRGGGSESLTDAAARWFSDAVGSGPGR